MTAPLKDTVALVTGASSGIGAATARTLAANGAAVAVVARRSTHGAGRRTASRRHDDARPRVAQQTRDLEMLRPQDVADAVSYMITRDRRVAVNEILIRAGEQTW